MPSYVAVVGPGQGAREQDLTDATGAGALLAAAGVVVITGGLDGVMAAAARGVREAGGTSIGLLPSSQRGDGDPAHSLLLPTGLGELRNALVVRTADVVLAIGGSWGTLSEVALAVRGGTPVVAVRSWDLPKGPVHHAEDIETAITIVMRLLGMRLLGASDAVRDVTTRDRSDPCAAAPVAGDGADDQQHEGDDQQPLQRLDEQADPAEQQGE
jgi:uncharacterized protein (TIGR00725 family)